LRSTIGGWSRQSLNRSAISYGDGSTAP
jgi:hypothetical protein